MGLKSAISGLCSCIVIKSVTMVSLSLLLQSDLMTLVRLNPRSQSALLAVADQPVGAHLDKNLGHTHSGSLGGTLAFREYLQFV